MNHGGPNINSEMKFVESLAFFPFYTFYKSRACNIDHNVVLTVVMPEALKPTTTFFH